MEGILKFNLNDADDRMAHLRAVKSTDMAIVLFEMSVNVKKGIENRIDNSSISTPDEALDAVFEEFFKLLDEHGVNIDEIIN